MPTISSSIWQLPPTTLVTPITTTLHLWRANLNLTTSQRCALESTLSEDEIMRVERFILPIHQQRFIASRGLLRHILADYLHQPAHSLIFEYSPHGKPYLANNTSIYFNLSHSDDWALFAISSQANVGVDIEHIRTTIDTNALAQRFFSEQENRQLKSLPAKKKQHAFFQLWTCKEAFIKAIGEGFSFPFKHFSVDILQNTPRLMDIHGDIIAAQSWSLASFSPTEGYMGAIAIKTPITQVSFWDKNL